MVSKKLRKFASLRRIAASLALRAEMFIDVPTASSGSPPGCHCRTLPLVWTH